MLTRLLIIGLDAMDQGLIQRWAAAGKLPAFQHLLESSVWGTTENPAGLEAGGVWPSFYTGVSPARHGMYYPFLRFMADTYEERLFRRQDFTAEPFWDRLSRDGLRFAVFDAPYTFRSEAINGVHVLDWGSHAPMAWPHTGVNALNTAPLELAREIEQRFGRDRIGNDDLVKLFTVEDYRKFRHDLVERIEKKTAIIRHLLDKAGWDCVLAVFHDAHSAGHRCWHLHDSEHPQHDSGLAQAVGDIVEDTYIAIDHAVAVLLDRVGPDTTTLVFASHGMGANYSASRLLDQILLRLEGIAPPENRQAMARALHRIWASTPRRMQELLAPARAKLWGGVRRRFVEPNRRQRKYFEIKNNDATGGVRINLVGREPNGLVQPGPEFDSLCDRLSEDLLAVVEMETGQPIVNRIIRTAQTHSGPRAPDLPDLLVDWNRDSPISRVGSPKVGTIEHVYRQNRTGDHRPAGLFLASGPQIEPRRLNQLTSVNDFAPTIAALLGGRLPDTDGNPITALIPS